MLEDAWGFGVDVKGTGVVTLDLFRSLEIPFRGRQDIPAPVITHALNLTRSSTDPSKIIQITLPFLRTPNPGQHFLPTGIFI